MLLLTAVCLEMPIREESKEAQILSDVA